MSHATGPVVGDTLLGDALVSDAGAGGAGGVAREPAGKAGPLLRSRRFAPLFWCQFFSAFNDSYIKAALGFILLYRLPADRSQVLIQIATAIFIAPSFVLSGLGGQWADAHDKAVVARRIKLAEFVGVAIAAAGFIMSSLVLLFAALALFGVLSALFGPVKYGILPDLLPREKLAAGNALVEGATFIAIIAGTFVAALSSGEGHNNPVWFALLTLAFAAIAYGASALIPRVGAGAPHHGGGGPARHTSASSATCCARPANWCANSGATPGCGAAASWWRCSGSSPRSPSACSPPR